MMCWFYRDENVTLTTGDFEAARRKAYFPIWCDFDDFAPTRWLHLLEYFLWTMSFIMPFIDFI